MVDFVMKNYKSLGIENEMFYFSYCFGGGVGGE